jgi:hypothetical protein
MLRSGTIAGGLIWAAAALILLPAASSGYTVEPGAYRAAPRFAVSYRGSGTWRTTYHSEPPNPGGMHDTNDARDSSAERWRLRFARPLGIRSAVLAGATGSEHATGNIDHTHVDGLFAADDQSARCAVAATTSRGERLTASVQLRDRRSAAELAITARRPAAEALSLLPASCPGQGDSLDGLADDYFSPGFSFSPNWGPERWFASQTVRVSDRVLHRARAIVIRLHDTRAGTPPTGCDVRRPSFERCTTGGSWSGSLRLTRRAQSAG